jgi:hypothetical protein
VAAERVSVCNLFATGLTALNSGEGSRFFRFHFAFPQILCSFAQSIMERRPLSHSRSQAPVQSFHYSNELENVTFREYGRNIQNMARHLLTVEDREKRTRMAITLVELMKQLNPVSGEPNDYYQKLWDHLYVITGMKLDVDGPFPKPDSEVLVKKPNPVPYLKGESRFRHYGRSIEELTRKAIEIKDEEEKEQASIYICRLMKLFVLTNSKEMLEDNVAMESLRKLSDGKLRLDPEKVAAQNLLSLNPKEITQAIPSNQNRGGGKNRNQRHFQHKRRR